MFQNLSLLMVGSLQTVPLHMNLLLFFWTQNEFSKTFSASKIIFMSQNHFPKIIFKNHFHVTKSFFKIIFPKSFSQNHFPKIIFMSQNHFSKSFSQNHF